MLVLHLGIERFKEMYSMNKNVADGNEKKRAME